jgi:hypothetical protein
MRPQAATRKHGRIGQQQPNSVRYGIPVVGINWGILRMVGRISRMRERIDACRSVASYRRTAKRKNEECQSSQKVRVGKACYCISAQSPDALGLNASLIGAFTHWRTTPSYPPGPGSGPLHTLRGCPLGRKGPPELHRQAVTLSGVCTSDRYSPTCSLTRCLSLGSGDSLQR